MDVVLLQVGVRRQACDALEVASEETLAGEVVFLADGLDVGFVAVERLLDGQDHELVNRLGCREPGEPQHEGGEVLGRDVQLVGIELNGTLLLVLLAEQVDELVEEHVLVGVLHVVDDSLLDGQGKELGDVGGLVGPQHDFLHGVIVSLVLSLDAQVAFQQRAHVVLAESDVAELEGVVVELWTHAGVLVDVGHEMAAREEREEDATRIVDHHAHTGHDHEVFVGLQCDVRSTYNDVEGAPHHNGDIYVVSIIDFLAGTDEGLSLLVKVVHNVVFPFERREKCVLRMIFGNDVSLQNHKLTVS